MRLRRNTKHAMLCIYKYLKPVWLTFEMPIDIVGHIIRNFCFFGCLFSKTHMEISNFLIRKAYIFVFNIKICYIYDTIFASS